MERHGTEINGPEINGPEITRHLPALRRYARCLSGSQQRGDGLVRLCLEALLADTSLLAGTQDIRVGLFRAFHRCLNVTPGGGHPMEHQDAGASGNVERHIRALPPFEREILLLTTLGEFSLDDAAVILDQTFEQAQSHLDRARHSLNAQTATRVLVIEDEPIIALDVAKTVTAMGHVVVGIADTRDKAVEMAAVRAPGIVLADIKLRDGSSGIDAANEILSGMDVPVIFVTAYPERLLTGERPEPTYLITKPFDADILRVTIAQALLMHPAAPVRATG